MRDECAILALKDMIEFLKDGGDISVYDGTNITVSRRKLVMETLEENFLGVQVFWVESICTNAEVIERNIKLTKLDNPDFANMSPEEATKDFLRRIEMYQQSYEHISDDEKISYIKMIDIGRDVLNDVYPRLSFLMCRDTYNLKS